MKNIKEILWDRDCTGIEEYTLRRWFYGALNKCSPKLDELDFKEHVMSISESRDEDSIDILSYNKGSSIKIEDFGWKELYNRELRDYLRRGVESFKIYDNLS